MLRVRVVLTLALAGVATGGCQNPKSAPTDAPRPAAAAKPAKPAEPAKPAAPAKPASPSKPATAQPPAGSLSPTPNLATSDSDVDRVADWLCGDFDNAAQAKADSAYTHLQRHAVRIWPGRSDGTWIYTEISAGVSSDIIVSQKVLSVSRRADGAVVLTPHTIKGDASSHAGAWRSKEPLGGVEPSGLASMPGCDVILWKSSEALYDGSTEGKGCMPSDKGFVVVELELSHDRVVHWERMLDAGYRLVQGPSRGGHAYVRVQSGKP